MPSSSLAASVVSSSLQTAQAYCSGRLSVLLSQSGEGEK